MKPHLHLINPPLPYTDDDLRAARGIVLGLAFALGMWLAIGLIVAMVFAL